MSGQLLGIAASESITYGPDFTTVVLKDGRQAQGNDLTFVDLLLRDEKGSQ